MATMNVSLPDEMKEWVEAQVQTGRFSNSSDVVRDLIRRRQEADDRKRLAIAELNAEIEKGLASGPGEPWDLDEFLSRMHREHGIDQ